MLYRNSEKIVRKMKKQLVMIIRRIKQKKKAEFIKKRQEKR